MAHNVIVEGQQFIEMSSELLLRDGEDFTGDAGLEAQGYVCINWTPDGERFSIDIASPDTDEDGWWRQWVIDLPRPVAEAVAKAVVESVVNDGRL